MAPPIYDPVVHGRLLDPKGASALLLADFSLRRGTYRLAELRCAGGGPPFLRIGGDIRYPEAPLRAWATAQVMRPLKTSTRPRPPEAA